MIRKSLMLVCAALLGTGLFVASAEAQYSPGVPGFILTPSTTTPGGQIIGTGFGCPRGSVVTFAIDGVTVGTATAQNDSEGTFSGSITAPSTPGQFVVTATCGSVVISNVLTVVASPTTRASTLPQTGSDSSMSLARVGLALMAAGGLVLLAVRRRHVAAA